MIPMSHGLPIMADYDSAPFFDVRLELVAHQQGCGFSILQSKPSEARLVGSDYYRTKRQALAEFRHLCAYLEESAREVRETFGGAA